MNEHNDHGEWCVCIDCMVSIDSQDRPEGFLKWQNGAPWNRLDVGICSYCGEMDETKSMNIIEDNNEIKLMCCDCAEEYANTVFTKAD